MGNFRKSGREKRGGRDGRSAEMHDVVCSDCGINCKVPFKPTNRKPVYCSQCFENYEGKGRGTEKSTREESRFKGRRENNFRDENINISRNENQYKDQIDKLIAKMDVIIDILSSKKEVVEVEEAKKPKKKIVKEKPEDKTKKEKPNKEKKIEKKPKPKKKK